MTSQATLRTLEFNLKSNLDKGVTPPYLRPNQGRGTKYPGAKDITTFAGRKEQSPGFSYMMGAW